MNDYEKYLQLFGNIPEFLLDYMNTSFFKRLDFISLQCGMDYASDFVYQFAFMITRFKHSLGTALLTWKLTHDKLQTIAALYHDAATPVFSHAIDYMNGDFIIQESTEQKLYQILSQDKDLQHLLKRDGFTVNDLVNFKQYSVVDLDRPRMCADRLDNVICNGFIWVKNLTFEEAGMILSDTTLYKNEDGVSEIGFKSRESALKVTEISDGINLLTHSKGDNYMMMLLASITKYLLNRNYFTYEDLFIMKEPEIVLQIEAICKKDSNLNALWEKFKNIQSIPNEEFEVAIKQRIVNPLVKGKRLIEPLH